MSRTVRDGREAAFERWAAGVLEAASGYPGHLGSALLRPGRGEAEHHLVYRFADPDRLAAWERSAERAAWLARAEHLVEDVRVHKTTGLETWFSLPDRPSEAPPRWKMAVVVLCAIFPISLTFQLLVGRHLVGLPMPARALATSAVMVPTMTWLVMPRLTALLAGWLYPARPAEPLPALAGHLVLRGRRLRAAVPVPARRRRRFAGGPARGVPRRAVRSLRTAAPSGRSR